jgi:hypothetical protein
MILLIEDGFHVLCGGVFLVRSWILFHCCLRHINYCLRMSETRGEMLRQASSTKISFKMM